MSEKPDRRGFVLARDVLGFQLKLVIDALRDVVTSPLALLAAGLDLVLLKRQPPRYFRAVLQLGRRSEDWIDLWSSTYDQHAQPENVDAVLDSVQALLRDPRAGARKAKVLKRWAEREIRRRARTPLQHSVTPADTGQD
ncbi:MAG: hypothetical protein ACT4NL_02910 [Pseudomarimonas sp.]